MKDVRQVNEWFTREVLPLEPLLMRFFRRNWRSESDLADLRQELYVRIYEFGLKEIPLQTKPFVFMAARNLLINHVRRARIVSIEAMADLDAMNIAVDMVTPEREITARDELRQLQIGLNNLPPRCREVVTLRRIEGLSQREVAEKLSVGEDTVEKQMMYGMRALINFMLGGSGKIQRRPKGSRKNKAVGHE
ncbi:MAG TPA: RNA polymerase sigma factor [Solimonas sp.]